MSEKERESFMRIINGLQEQVSSVSSALQQSVVAIEKLTNHVGTLTKQFIELKKTLGQ